MSSYDFFDLCMVCVNEQKGKSRGFFPCDCGMQVCRLCVEDLIAKGPGVCPKCNKPYKRAKFQMIPVHFAEEKATEKLATDNKNDFEIDYAEPFVKVEQPLAVYVHNFPLSGQTGEELKSQEYFGKYGKIKAITYKYHPKRNDKGIKVASIFITFSKSEEALRCVKEMEGSIFKECTIKATIGTNKYCRLFVEDKICPDRNFKCQYYHEWKDPKDEKYFLKSRDAQNRIPKVKKLANRATSAKGKTSGENKAPKAANIGTSALPKAAAWGKENNKQTLLVQLQKQKNDPLFAQDDIKNEPEAKIDTKLTNILNKDKVEIESNSNGQEVDSNTEADIDHLSEGDDSKQTVHFPGQVIQQTPLEEEENENNDKNMTSSDEENGLDEKTNFGLNQAERNISSDFQATQPQKEKEAIDGSNNSHFNQTSGRFTENQSINSEQIDTHFQQSQSNVQSHLMNNNIGDSRRFSMFNTEINESSNMNFGQSRLSNFSLGIGQSNLFNIGNKNPNTWGTSTASKSPNVFDLRQSTIENSNDTIEKLFGNLGSKIDANLQSTKEPILNRFGLGSGLNKDSPNLMSNFQFNRQGNDTFSNFQFKTQSNRHNIKPNNNLSINAQIQPQDLNAFNNPNLFSPPKSSSKFLFQNDPLMRENMATTYQNSNNFGLNFPSNGYNTDLNIPLTSPRLPFDIKNNILEQNPKTDTLNNFMQPFNQTQFINNNFINNFNPSINESNQNTIQYQLPLGYSQQGNLNNELQSNFGNPKSVLNFNDSPYTQSNVFNKDNDLIGRDEGLTSSAFQSNKINRNGMEDIFIGDKRQTSLFSNLEPILSPPKVVNNISTYQPPQFINNNSMNQNMARHNQPQFNQVNLNNNFELFNPQLQRTYNSNNNEHSNSFDPNNAQNSFQQPLFNNNPLLNPYQIQHNFYGPQNQNYGVNQPMPLQNQVQKALFNPVSTNVTNQSAIYNSINKSIVKGNSEDLTTRKISIPGILPMPPKLFDGPTNKKVQNTPHVKIKNNKDDDVTVKVKNKKENERNVQAQKVKDHKVEIQKAKENKIEAQKTKDHKVEVQKTKDHKVEVQNTKFQEKLPNAGFKNNEIKSVPITILKAKDHKSPEKIILSRNVDITKIAITEAKEVDVVGAVSNTNDVNDTKKEGKTLDKPKENISKQTTIISNEKVITIEESLKDTKNDEPIKQITSPKPGNIDIDPKPKNVVKKVAECPVFEQSPYSTIYKVNEPIKPKKNKDKPQASEKIVSPSSPVEESILTYIEINYGDHFDAENELLESIYNSKDISSIHSNLSEYNIDSLKDEKADIYDLAKLLPLFELKYGEIIPEEDMEEAMEKFLSKNITVEQDFSYLENYAHLIADPKNLNFSILDKETANAFKVQEDIVNKINQFKNKNKKFLVLDDEDISC